MLVLFLGALLIFGVKATVLAFLWQANSEL